MPARTYPDTPVPSLPMVSVRTGPRAPRTGQREAADSSGMGDPNIRSGPVHAGAPSGAMGTLGWGLHTPRFTVPSAPNARHGRRPLSDPRQLHYDPPGTIPGPGGTWGLGTPLGSFLPGLDAEIEPRPLASGPPPLRPYASSMPLPSEGGRDAGTSAAGVLPPEYYSEPAPSLTYTPANPASTRLTAPVMMGLGLAYTPAASGVVLATVTGLFSTLTVNVSAQLGARYGTGPAPVNGDPPRGSRWGTGASDWPITASQLVSAAVPFTMTQILWLVPDTAYWFDLSLATSNAVDAAQVTNVVASFTELAQ